LKFVVVVVVVIVVVHGMYDIPYVALISRVNNGSMGHGSVGQMGQFLDGSYGSWVDALSPMTHLHIYRKHVVKATFVVGDN